MRSEFCMATYLIARFPVKIPRMSMRRAPAQTGIKITNSTVPERSVPSLCTVQIIVECINALYFIPPEPAESPNNTLIIAGFDEQFVSRIDLQVSVPYVADYITN